VVFNDSFLLLVDANYCLRPPHTDDESYSLLLVATTAVLLCFVVATTTYYHLLLLVSIVLKGSFPVLVLLFSFSLFLLLLANLPFRIFY
jgi:hypothetical protein